MGDVGLFDSKSDCSTSIARCGTPSNVATFRHVGEKRIQLTADAFDRVELLNGTGEMLFLERANAIEATSSTKTRKAGGRGASKSAGDVVSRTKRRA